MWPAMGRSRNRSGETSRPSAPSILKTVAQSQDGRRLSWFSPKEAALEAAEKLGIRRKAYLRGF